MALRQACGRRLRNEGVWPEGAREDGAELGEVTKAEVRQGLRAGVGVLPFFWVRWGELANLELRRDESNLIFNRNFLIVGASSPPPSVIMIIKSRWPGGGARLSPHRLGG